MPRSPGSPTAMVQTCRRCSECRGENHHWLEACNPPAPDGDGFVGYECKHCDARAEMCDACDLAVEAGHVCDFGEDGPYVCPGCHAVGGQPCAPGCIDDEMRQRAEDDHG